MYSIGQTIIHDRQKPGFLISCHVVTIVAANHDGTYDIQDSSGRIIKDVRPGDLIPIKS